MAAINADGIGKEEQAGDDEIGLPSHAGAAGQSIEMGLLICINGYRGSRPALEYGIWLARQLRLPVSLLGIIEVPGQKEAVHQALQEATQALNESQLVYQVHLETGRATLIIPRYAEQFPYLTVVGTLGRPAWKRALQGRSFRRLLEKIETPILYVPEPRYQMKKILLCMGGLSFARGVEHLTLHMARATGAEVTLLHIVEPITLEYRTARTLQEGWQNILETDTPQGRNLARSLSDLKEAGITTQFKVRHGNVISEILEEIRAGQYDLMAMGSPYSSRSLRHLYMPNVTAEVAETIRCPVLTARKGHELVE